MIRTDGYMNDLGRILVKDYPWGRLSGRDVLVTGASGMIGSVLTDVLVSKASEYDFQVVAMSRGMDGLKQAFPERSEHLRLVSHDVNKPMGDIVCDTVFHCASNTHPRAYSLDPIGTIETNVIGLKNLLDMASDAGDGRFVFASSVEIYGENRGDVDAFDESYCGYIDCSSVRSGYNESKRVGEALCQAYGSQKDLDFVIPRLSRIYGPSVRPDDSKAMTQFLFKAVSGQDIVLKSKGTQLFSYCYVMDAVDAMLHLFFNGESKNAYNVSGKDSDVTLLSLAKRVSEIAGVDVVFDMPDEVESRGYSKATKAVLDISKIRSTGWEPSYSLDEGLMKTIDDLSSMRSNQVRC